MIQNRRTLMQLGVSAAIALAMAIGFVLVGGLSPTQAQGRPSNVGAQASGSGNHGSIVSSVARSTCTATNPHNPSVSNHGMCVSSVARSQHTATSTSSSASASTAGTTQTQATSGGKSGTHGKHGKKHTKKSKSKHHKK